MSLLQVQLLLYFFFSIAIIYFTSGLKLEVKKTHTLTKFLFSLFTNLLRFIVTLFIRNCHTLFGTDLLGDVLADIVRSDHLHLVAVWSREGPRALRLAGLVQ